MRDSWDIIKIILNENKLSKSQIDSFNQFCEVTLQKILKNNITKKIKNDRTHYEIFFSNPVINKPKYKEMNNMEIDLYPTDCIKRFISYSGKLYVDLNIIKYKTKNGVTSKTETVSKDI